MNLFVTFTDGEHSSVSMGYTTPALSRKIVFEEGSGSANDTPRRSASVRSFSSLGSGFETPNRGRKKHCPYPNAGTTSGYVSGNENVGFNTPGASGGIPIEIVDDNFREDNLPTVDHP